MRIVRLPKPASHRWVLCAAILILSGCGYHFGASGTALPATAHTIYVERFINHTHDNGLNDEFMRALKDQIASHKRLDLVDTSTDADLILTGEIKTSLGIPNGFNSILEPTQYSQTMSIHASLRDAHTDTVIWSTNGLSDTESYPVVAQSAIATTPTFLQGNLRAHDIQNMTDIQVAHSEQRFSRDQMMANLAHRMYDSMSTGF